MEFGESENMPLAQNRHVVALALGWYRPTGHPGQLDVLVNCANEPGGQARQAVDAETSVYDPGEHERHVVMDAFGA